MKHRLPYTPFSTPFSPSKQMVEARIRGIIAGPQKRPPLPLLFLVFAFCFLSVNLVSCQPSQEGPAALLSLTLADGGEVYLVEGPPRDIQEPMTDTVGVLYYRPAGGEAVELDALDYGPEHHYWNFVSLEPFTDVLGSDGFVFSYTVGGAWDSSDYYAVENGRAALIAPCHNYDIWQEDLDGDGELELLNNYHAAGFLDVYDREGGQVICTQLNAAARNVVYALLSEDIWVSLDWNREDGVLTASWVEDGQEDEQRITHPAGLYYRARAAAPLPQTDLNRNGIPETIETFVDIDSGTHRLTITENGEVIYATTAWNDESNREAVFLYRDGEGKDWLLRYRPILYSSGRGEYLYQVYCPNDAEEFSTPYKWLTFDISFSGGVGGYNDFDPDAIAAYIGEVNALLRDSTLLICSDPNLEAGFRRLGRLEDNLWWIDETNVRDPNKSLADNLRAYQEVMEAAVSNRPAVPYVPTPGTPERQAALEAYRAVLEGKATFYATDVERNVDIEHVHESMGVNYINMPAEFTLVDLDGDGVEELVLYFVWLGNGGTVEILHWMDGEVCGYTKVGRGFGNPKTDGTYTGSDSAFTGYLLRIKSFDRSGFEEETTAYFENSYYSGTYTLNGQSSTKQKVMALFERQDAKEGVTWYDLNDANIKAAFS